MRSDKKNIQVTDQKTLTGEAAEFAVSLTFKDIPDDAVMKPYLRCRLSPQARQNGVKASREMSCRCRPMSFRTLSSLVKRPRSSRRFFARSAQT